MPAAHERHDAVIAVQQSIDCFLQKLVYSGRPPFHVAAYVPVLKYVLAP
jgi:hypothetical protein